MSSATRSASVVMPSCFTITFELQCAIEHVHCVTRGRAYDYILNTYSPAWRAVHMISLAVAVYEKSNCILCLQPSARTPNSTIHST